MDFLSVMNFLSNLDYGVLGTKIVTGYTLLSTLASMYCAFTPTPNDDTALATVQGAIRRVANVLGWNVAHAKNHTDERQRMQPERSDFKPPDPWQ